jgi:hypothetical protein
MDDNRCCCRACGQFYETQLHPSTTKQQTLRRSSRTTSNQYKHTASSHGSVIERSRNQDLCMDCVQTLEILVTQDDDFDDDAFISQSLDIREAAVVRHVDASSLRFMSDPISVPNSTVDGCNLSSNIDAVEEATGATAMEDRVKNNTKDARLVTPESSKRSQAKCQKICRECNVQTVPENFMEYCNRCYALRCKDKKLNVTTGRCRLCTGVVVTDPSHQYCSKCYPAKQRDDAKRARIESYQRHHNIQSTQQQKTAHRIPYVCTKCGDAVRDCLKALCQPCYALIRRSRRNTPKLMKPVFAKTKLDLKRKYR